MTVDLENLIGQKTKSWTGNMVSVVGVRNQRVEPVVATRHLQNNENRPVFASYCLGRAVGGERVERQKTFLEEDRQRPGGGRAEHGSSEELSPCLQCRFHSLGQLKL